MTGLPKSEIWRQPTSISTRCDRTRRKAGFIVSIEKERVELEEREGGGRGFGEASSHERFKQAERACAGRQTAEQGAD